MAKGQDLVYIKMWFLGFLGNCYYLAKKDHGFEVAWDPRNLLLSFDHRKIICEDC